MVNMRVLSFSLLPVAIMGQNLDYLPNPEPIFAPIKMGTGTMQRGNGVNVSPDDTVVYATLNNGNLFAANPNTGEEIFTYVPESFRGTASTCSSRIAFHDGDDPFVLHSVIDESTSTTSRLVRLSHPDGVVKWTATIDGTISGAPEISGNGDYVFITAVALDGPFAPVGVFMILRADDGSEFYREDVAGLPFGPPGLYANPTLGFYPGGEANRNDLVMFACSFITNVAVPSNGCLYVFQFPVGFSGASTNGLQLNRLGSPGWVTNIKPTLFLNGLSMYWSVSRAQVKGWYGDDINEISFRFQRVARYSAQFLRGNPTASTPNSRPVLNANEDTIFLAGAAAEMHSLNIDLTTRWTTPSVAPIVVDPVITPDGQAMFWAEDFGRVHGASTADGVDIWQSIVPGHTFSEMDMDSTGSRLYFGNGFGNLFGWTVATGPTPNSTPLPTISPTLAPTCIPQKGPLFLGFSYLLCLLRRFIISMKE